jgi:glycosyltransferase involved in cell wall biosynthesis
MACGTPCICADAASLPEVAGGAALLFPPGDDRALARQTARILQDPLLASDLAARGQSRAAEFDWWQVAARTYQVYLEAKGKERAA